jgi:branched-chain amino acid aminotransferase
MVEFAGVGSLIHFDGALIPEREAKVHVLSGAVKYGATVFEGICAYSGTDGGLGVFRLPEHVRRMREGMRLMRFEHDWSEEHLAGVVLQVLRANELTEDAHVRLSAYVLNEGFLDATAPVALGCLAVRRHPKALEEKSVRAQVSSWRRIDDQTMPPRLKCAANYHNGRLATIQARAEGYDEAILLTAAGKVAESAGACIVAVRDGVVLTPTVTGGILESVTRATLIELCEKELDTEVRERDIDRTELYGCDEAFLCGSGYEITPIVSVDGLALGAGGVGPVTRAIFEAYDAATRGAMPGYARWLTPV